MCINAARSLRKVLAMGLAAAALGMAGPVMSQTVTGGTITHVFADPDDFVVVLDKNGSCGSGYFHIKRANANFKEMVTVALTAFAANKPMTFFVVGCAATRNIISHGYASR